MATICPEIKWASRFHIPFEIQNILNPTIFTNKNPESFGFQITTVLTIPVLDPIGIRFSPCHIFVCRPPAYAASYEEINDFLGKGHYKKLYQETNPLKIFWLVFF